VDLDVHPHESQEEDDDQFIDRYLKTLEKEPEQPPLPPAYEFSVEKAEAASARLHGMYKVLEPGGHYCKRSASYPTAAGFSHCAKGAVIASRLQRLDALLERRAHLELTRDVFARVQALSGFVANLRRIVRDECRVYHHIMRNSLVDEPVTQLGTLCGLSEDLRSQLGHWSAVKQSLHTNSRLRPMLPDLCATCTMVKVRFVSLIDEAIYWMQRLVAVGFSVLAHTDLERIGQDVLWNIARGLEDFISIVSTARRTHHLSQIENLNFAFPASISKALCQLHSGRPSNEIYGNRFSQISVVDVLKLVACERAKYAAVATKDYFVGGREFVRIVRSVRTSRSPWLTLKPKSNVVEALDYSEPLTGRTDSTRSDQSSRSGSVAVHQVANERISAAPDLTTQPSPLIDFARRESTFASRFLHVVCNSTCLVKNTLGATPADGGTGMGVTSNGAVSRGVLQRSEATAGRLLSNNYVHPRQQRMFASKAVKSPPPTSHPFIDSDVADDSSVGGDGEPCAVNPPGDDTAGGEFERLGSGRKSVSWGDTGVSTCVQQMTQNYLTALWLSFVERLFEYLVAVEWGGFKESKERLGSIVCCPDSISQIIQLMVHSAALAGYSSLLKSCTINIFSTM